MKTKWTTRGFPDGVLGNNKTSEILGPKLCNYRWFKLQDEMEDDWNGCTHGHGMLEYIASHVSENDRNFKPLLLTVCLFLSDILWERFNKWGVTHIEEHLSFLDKAKNYAKTGTTSDKEWSEIESRMQDHLHNKRYTASIAEAVVPSGAYYLEQAGAVCLRARKEKDYIGGIQKTLSALADIVRAAYPEYPKKDE